MAEPVVFVRAIEELRRLDEPHRRGERIRVLLHQLRNATEASHAIANPDAENAFIKSLRLNERAVLKTLQRSMRSSSEDGNRLDKLPLKFMESITPALPGATWLRILRRVLNGTAVVVSEDDLVLVVNSRLLSVLGELIVTLSDRLLDQVALWFLQLHAHLLPIQPEYMIDRVLFCHSAVELRFGSVVAAEHVANQFNEMRRRQIEAVLRDVLLRMTQLVKSGDWVPRDTADKMLAKLDNITVKLWSNSLFTDAWLTRMYSGFPDRAPSYVHFWLATGKAQSLWLLGTARSTAPGISIYDEDARWRAEELHFRSAARDPPIEYDYWANAVLVSPAALYAPLFYAQAMDAIVYAGLGATVARVAARAFDERVAPQQDAFLSTCTVNSTICGSDSIAVEYGLQCEARTEVSECLFVAAQVERALRSFPNKSAAGPDGLKGIDISAGENQSDWLPDSARRQFVLRAKCWQPAVKAAITGLEALTLRALEGGLHVLGERSPWQVFFLSFCQPLCGLRAESGGPRAPGGRLCNQLLLNEPRFSSAFNCRLGEQPMARVSKC
ncbi:hypothetical protein HPB50_025033 [Hyalomma asiaticum]|uniref:Uncharacterized protein n=1 Tax=Hyalomma asiaticum TaxID=266040 RepID=A0ACB7TBV8_HYAAI|nr:hypothetical protein HPB50_025033 [Hyalomma asiaticum]